MGVVTPGLSGHDRRMTTFEHPTELFPSVDDEQLLPEIVDPPGAPRAPARAWFLGEGEIPPAEEPTGDAGLEQMHQEATALPLLDDLRRALDLIGDGLPVKRNGDPYVRDVREFARRQGAPVYAYERSSPTFTELVALLDALGWVAIEDRRLHRAEESPAVDGLDPEAEGYLDAVRAVVREGVRSAQRRPWWHMHAAEERTVREALLIATTDDGLLLPWASPYGSLDHCREHTLYLADLLGHPRIRGIPLDHETGHVSAAALTELAACRESMSRLEAWGLVVHGEMEERHRDAGYSCYRAPLLMRGVLAGWG